jgi:hypothetical protein
MYIIILNIIAVFFLSAAIVFPAIFLGTGLTADFWRAVWPMALLTVLALAGMNVYFFKNRRLFSLLKKEDWPALADYLEKRIYKDGKYSSRDVRLLVHSYIVLGNFDATVRLENKIAPEKPALLDELALMFGAARVLGGNKPAAVEFFKDRLEKGNVPDGEWFRWFYGFSLFLAGSSGQAQAVFGELAAEAKDVIVTGLSAYFLSEHLGDRPADTSAVAGNLSRAKEGAGRVRKGTGSLAQWGKRAAKVTTEMHGAIIRKYIADAGEWIFSDRSL